MRIQGFSRQPNVSEGRNSPYDGAAILPYQQEVCRFLLHSGTRLSGREKTGCRLKKRGKWTSGGFPLKSIIDTLPLVTSDVNDGWREMKLVRYFYNDQYELKKIVFRKGGEGYDYFYFEGISLRKVRVRKQGGLINLQYYFTDDDNHATPSEIKQRIVNSPEKKEWYEVLNESRTFWQKFTSLL